MIDALSTATAGLRASAQRFDKSAQDVVKAASADATSPDLATSIVDSKTSEISFKANAAVIKAADKVLGTLLDTIA